MKKELVEKIREAAPKFMKDLWGDMSQTCMHWGIETGDGWYEIILQLAKDIEVINNTLPDGQFFYAGQIKEKFGELRCYVDETIGIPQEIRDKVSNLIDEAENKSWNTCEVCGKPATQTTKGWIKRLCDDCMKKREEEYGKMDRNSK